VELLLPRHGRRGPGVLLLRLVQLVQPLLLDLVLDKAGLLPAPRQLPGNRGVVLLRVLQLLSVLLLMLDLLLPLLLDQPQLLPAELLLLGHGGGDDSLLSGGPAAGLDREEPELLVGAGEGGQLHVALHLPALGGAHSCRLQSMWYCEYSRVL
jgi:hypothetical protein